MTGRAAIPSLREAWMALAPGLGILDPLPFSAAQWSLLERLHSCFNDREAHTRLPLPIARFRPAAVRKIYRQAATLDDVETVSLDAGRRPPDSRADPMADYARLYGEDVDALMGVLVPSARFRKGHYAYGRFTVPSPHGLHTDHSAEDPAGEGEPICIARIETLGTHYVAGDYRALDPVTQRKLEALRYWTPRPEGDPEEIFQELLRAGTLATIPVNHVILMVAGNASPNAQVTQHIAARPPEGGQDSAFFQRQYRLT